MTNRTLVPWRRVVAQINAADQSEGYQAARAVYLDLSHDRQRGKLILQALQPELAARLADDDQRDEAKKRKRRIQVARAEAVSYGARLRVEYPELIENPELAAKSDLPMATLDRFFLTDENRARMREHRASMIRAGEVCSRLGITLYRLNKLDAEGVLPHCYTRPLQVKGKTVHARCWFPGDVAAFVMTLNAPQAA